MNIVDSWDSVNNQPSCILCGMVFSTMTKLETHVKYSVSNNYYNYYYYNLLLIIDY